MRRKTQKAKQVSILILFAVLALGFVSSVHARQVPRFDKQHSDCKKASGVARTRCFRDLKRRSRCVQSPGLAGRKCYIRYAAGYFQQDAGAAMRVATCESYPWLDNTLTAPQVGMWQFNPGTWASLPNIFHKGRGIHSPKYSSLGAMYYWSVGHKSDWQCT